MYDHIPEELKKLNQWVCVNAGSKVPMQAGYYIPASPSDYRTWSAFDMAAKQVESNAYDGIGFVFADNGIVGIDIDDGFDEDGIMTEKAVDIISRCNGYTELSRSHRGFHILLKGQLPFKGKNNHDGVQIYQTGRYFIMTGNYVFGSLCENQSAIDYVVDKYFQETERTSTGKPSSKVYNVLWSKVQGKIPLNPTYPEIVNGSRNISLTSLAGAMRNADYSREAITRVLHKANATACKPPLPQDEVQAIVSSVMRYKI